MKTPRYILCLLIAFISIGLSAQELSPYMLVAESDLTIESAELKIKSALENQGFELIGDYYVAGNKARKVIVYTRKDLKEIAAQIKDRGALGAALKVGLKTDNGLTKISYLNPEYLFQAYFMDTYDKHSNGLSKIASDVEKALSPLGDVNKGFGGAMTAEDLRKYHYKIMMPYFTDPVELMEFSSFKEGLSTIENNLKNNKGATLKVYSLIFQDKNIAVWGVGLMSDEEGEKEFLPIIGEDNLAALPYEIILQGNQATMLHGRYRLALHWPELSLGTFMKIKSTPGDIEDVMVELCK